MKILFRCDGGVIRGSGHLVRCMTLADILKQAGHFITFACRADAGPLLALIEDKGFNLFIMPAPDAPPVKTEEIWSETTQAADFHLCRDLLKDQSFDWIILDHYGLSRPWEALARAVTHKIMVIDDLANRPHDCDFLLDQNEYADKNARYNGFLPSACQTFLGAEFALMREEFYDARRHLKPIPATIKKMMILMGSTDYHGLTLRLMNLLVPQLGNGQLEVHVVTGVNNRDKDSIQALASERPAFKLHINHQKISDLMLDTDLAFGAGGTATWEMCCLGVPLLLLTFADNQIQVARDGDRIGFARYLGHYDTLDDAKILSAVNELSRDPAQRQNMREISCNLTDGLGARRIAAAIIAEDVTLRPATQTDSTDILKWRNDPVTREMSLTTEEISPEEHEAWLTKKLASPDTLLLIAEYDGQKAGCLRYDLSDQAIVSINLNPAWRGHGLGPAILHRGEAYIPATITSLSAEIKADNAPSIRAFESAGFKLSHKTPNSITYLKSLTVSGTS